MFGRKKKQAMLALYNDAGAELAKMPLEQYSIPESVVIALSIRYFDDPEPCYIHRGAVHQRVFVQLCEQYENSGPVRTACMAEELRACFPNITSLSLWEETK